MNTAFASAQRTSLDIIYSRFLALQRHSEEFIFINAIPNIVMILDENRQIVFANKALFDFFEQETVEKVLGLRSGELIGCNHALRAAHGCGTSKHCVTCGMIRSILSSQMGNVAADECRILSRNNQAFDYKVHTVPITIQDQNYVILTLIDISEAKRKRVLEKLFFHDVMNTVNGIQGFAELLPNATAEEMNQFSDILAHLAIQLVDEINGQRDLLAVEAGEFCAHYAEFESDEVLNDVHQLYKNHSVGVEKTIVLAPENQNFVIESDIRLVRRILSNMVKNALEATDIHGVVTISTRRVFNNFVMSVHNAGFMLPTVQLQIFKRSFSTKGSGRGLGTYSMRLLAENYLQGRAGFYSDKKNGTVFYAIIPMKSVQD
jgi:signal transduction histidine kinase